MAYIGNFIIPTDELIFFRGVGIPPTSFGLGIRTSTSLLGIRTSTSTSLLGIRTSTSLLRSSKSIISALFQASSIIFTYGYYY